jgi:monofunctional glycosyltransferase
MEADWRPDSPSSGRGWERQPPSATPPWGSPPQLPQPPERSSYRPSRRGPLRRLGRALMGLAIVFLCLDLATEACFVSLNWVNPPVTAYMLEGGGDHLHDYVSLRYVSRYMIAATLAHEDAQLPTRFTGVDWDQWWSRATAFLNHRKDPHGSPIPEQLTKNLLLWPSRNPFRKILDAVLAEQMVHAISKQRVLELYLNEAQFGPNIYGVCDAAWYYFDEPPDYMSWNDAYELMGVLPSPIHAHRLPGGGIDMNPATRDGRIELGLIRGAQIYVPIDLRIDGGLELVREMGITGTAHGQPNGPGSCRTMPQDIRQLIAADQRSRAASGQARASVNVSPVAPGSDTAVVPEALPGRIGRTPTSLLGNLGGIMIAIAIILLIIGTLARTGIVWTFGVVVLALGLIALLLGMTDHAIGGRRHYF